MNILVETHDKEQTMKLTKKEKTLVKQYQAMRTAYHKDWLIKSEWNGFPMNCPRCGSSSIVTYKGPILTYCQSCAFTAKDCPEGVWPTYGEKHEG
jgi:transposase-like protein